MSAVQLNLTIQTTPTLLVCVPSGVQATAVIVANNHNQPIYVGTSGVATSGATVGVPVAAGASSTFWLHANDTLYAVSAALTTANCITVLYSGV